MAFYRVAREIVTFLTIVWTRMRRQGRQHIPSSGGAVLVCNHLCLWDMITVACMTRRLVVFVGKKEIAKSGFLRWVVKKVGAILVDRDKPELSVIKQIIEKVKEGRLVLIFPEGTRNREPEKVEILPIQEGAAMVALRAKAPVIPMWIKGRYNPVTGIKIIAGEAVDFSGIEGQRKQDVELATKKIEESLIFLRRKQFLTKT